MPKSSKHIYLQTHFILEFPEAALQLREKYILLRRTRPIVPAPRYTPMPDRVPAYPENPGRQYEEKCRLYSVYMRPWTLHKAFATPHVPFTTDLATVPCLSINFCNIFSSNKAQNAQGAPGHPTGIPGTAQRSPKLPRLPRKPQGSHPRPLKRIFNKPVLKLNPMSFIRKRNRVEFKDRSLN